MDLRAVRDRIAAEAPDGIHGHARPPGQIGAFPLYIVGDPTETLYRSTFGGKVMVTLPIHVVVQRTAEQDGTGELDGLVSTLPAELEAITPGGLWVAGEFRIVRQSGGYYDFAQTGTDRKVHVIGLATDLTATIRI